MYGGSGGVAALAEDEKSLLAARDRVIEDPDWVNVWRKEDRHVRVCENDPASSIGMAVVASCLDCWEHE